jgi:hypothetical protein
MISARFDLSGCSTKPQRRRRLVHRFTNRFRGNARSVGDALDGLDYAAREAQTSSGSKAGESPTQRGG